MRRVWLTIGTGGALVGAGIGGFAIAIHAYAAWLLGPAVEAGIGPTPQTLMIVGGSLVMFVSLMISQAIESVTRAYYARDDLDLILTSPASAERLFHVRTSILAVQTVALSVFIASPALNVLAWLDGAKWLSAYGILISLGLMSTAVSVTLTLVLFRLVGPQRTRLIAQIVAAIGPSLVNALNRARANNANTPSLRFAQIASDISFTQREAEVADLLVTGQTDDEICGKLGFSKPTLRTHIASIFRKSGLNRRSQLALFLAEKNHHL